MAKVIDRRFAGMLVVLLSAQAVLGEGPTRRQTVSAGKAATALVECKQGPFLLHGSAFCIHPSGIFITNEHVLRPPNPGFGDGRASAISLILNSGQPTAKVLAATVLRADADLDLALLQVARQDGLPTLPLGSDEQLAETADVIAFGFPFGEAIAGGGGQQEHPAVSVNTGKVTSLRMRAGKLHRIQVDAVLNPGNSGGPVLDQDGKVIGVVVSGLAAGPDARANIGVNFLIPVSHVARFVARPEVTFAPPFLKLAAVHDAVEFQARALPFVPSAKPLDLELVLKAENHPDRTFKMSLQDGVHRVDAVPVPRPEGPALLRITAVYPEGSVTGLVEDGAIQAAGTTVKFSQARRLVNAPESRVILREGKALRGPLAGVDAVAVRLGNTSVVLDLGKATEVRLEPPLGLKGLSATVVARQDGREVGRFTRFLEVQGVPAPDEEEALLDLEVPTLEQDVVVYRLDAPVSDVAVGGGGRYLILHLPKLSKLAVFDVNQAKVVKYLSVPADNVRFTAGLDKLVVALGEGTVQRWSLKTFEQELSVAAPTKGRVLALSMGAASQGPALVYAKEGNNPFPAATAFLLTLDKLERREVAWVQQGMQAFLSEHIHLRSSPDGRASGLWCTGQSPTGVTWIRWENRFGQVSYNHSSNGYVVPGAGGQVLYTGQGMFTRLGMIPNQGEIYPGTDPAGRYLPAHGSGGYYLHLGSASNRAIVNPRLGGGNPGANPMQPGGVVIRKMGIDRPIIQLPDLEIPGDNEETIQHDFTLDKRFHFLPQAKLLIVIPPTDDRLVLHRIDVDAALEKISRGGK
jgi:hypothetical protein